MTVCIKVILYLLRVAELFYPAVRKVGVGGGGVEFGCQFWFLFDGRRSMGLDGNLAIQLSVFYCISRSRSRSIGRFHHERHNEHFFLACVTGA